MLDRVGIVPEPAFDDENSRQLRFATNLGHVTIIRVRSFDVATFVAFGAAHLGVAGNDVLMEFDYPEIYAPLDLRIGACRLSVAEPKEMVEGTIRHGGAISVSRPSTLKSPGAISPRAASRPNASS